MFSFNRKSGGAQSKETWDEAKYEYEAAIERCCKWKSVTLALCGFQRFLSFNLAYRNEEERKNLAETDFQFRGVVHEEGQFTKHVRCEVEILPTYPQNDYIGSLVLTHMHKPGDKAPHEYQGLELCVRLHDPSSMLRTSLIEGLRDAALSGFRFLHIQLECPEPTNEQFEKALSDMRAQGHASRRDILAVKMWPGIELQNAPVWARRKG